jgi:hypothetical protein
VIAPRDIIGGTVAPHACDCIAHISMDDKRLEAANTHTLITLAAAALLGLAALLLQSQTDLSTTLRAQDALHRALRLNEQYTVDYGAFVSAGGDGCLQNYLDFLSLTHETLQAQFASTLLTCSLDPSPRASSPQDVRIAAIQLKKFLSDLGELRTTIYQSLHRLAFAKRQYAPLGGTWSSLRHALASVRFDETYQTLTLQRKISFRHNLSAMTCPKKEAPSSLAITWS